jgi:hypothetical protein
VSCDATRFVLAHPVELHPSRAVPEEPTRSVLAAVAQILERDPSILFVRIEVYSASPPGTDVARRRAALSLAQRRADALFQYLWRKRGISAERMEAVALEPRVAEPPPSTPWKVVFRIVQRARR